MSIYCSYFYFNTRDSIFNIKFNAELEDADAEEEDADAEQKNPNLEIRIFECDAENCYVSIKYEPWVMINGERSFNGYPNPEITDGLKKALYSRL